jgi:hypothetical protein
MIFDAPPPASTVEAGVVEGINEITLVFILLRALLISQRGDPFTRQSFDLNCVSQTPNLTPAQCDVGATSSHHMST